nr:hypothetical protein [Chitinophagaceae bacterium]
MTKPFCPLTVGGWLCQPAFSCIKSASPLVQNLVNPFEVAASPIEFSQEITFPKKKILQGTEKYISLTFALLLGLLSYSQQSPLQRGFMNPPDSMRPSCYWYWLNDNISPEGVTKDVEAMAEAGIGRAFIGNIGLGADEVPYGNVKMFSDGWWKTIHAAFAAASKKNISLGLFNGPGWSQSGGPWVKPTQTMRYIAGQEIIVEGPRTYDEQLPEPGEHFQDVAVLAFPQPVSDQDIISHHKPRVSSDAAIENFERAFDGDTATGALFPDNLNKESVINIDINTAESFTARSLAVYPANHPMMAKM